MLAPRPCRSLSCGGIFGGAAIMHVDTDAYIALGFLAATVIITLGLFGFVLTRKMRR